MRVKIKFVFKMSSSTFLKTILSMKISLINVEVRKMTVDSMRRPDLDCLAGVGVFGVSSTDDDSCKTQQV